MKKPLAILVILLAMNANAQWVQMTNSNSNVTYINDFASSGIYLFTLTESNGVFRSSDNGMNWVAVNNGLPIPNNICIIAIGSTIFVGSTTGGVFRTTNFGDNWVTVNNGLTKLNVLSLCVSGTTIFAGTGGPRGSIFRSTNDGTSWNEVFVLPSDGTVGNFATKGTNVFAAASFFLSSKIYISSNNGLNWTAASGSLTIISSIIGNESNLFIGTYQGVGISTNNGTNWSSGGLQQFWIYDFAVSGSNLFAGTDTGGVYLSTNNGTSWTPKNQGFNNILPVVRLFIYNNYIFTGGLYIWRRSLSEIIGIQNISTEIPSKYSLSQNYPNPFNPVTKIKFDVPIVKQAFLLVNLKVYDLMGREIQNLVNESLNPGTYEVTFDASNLNSGIYFYQMSAGNFTVTKKMLYIK